MAPTTLPGQKTTSSIHGRDIETQGYPVKISEMFATMEGASYIVRRSLHDAKSIRQVKNRFALALEAQISRVGFFDG